MRKAQLHNKDFIFETTGQMNEFILNVPEVQKIGLTIKIYISEDNQYRQIKDV